MTVTLDLALPPAGHASEWAHPWWPLWLLVWAAVIGAAVWLVVRRRGPGPDALDPARELLALRYARGEISAGDYHERLAVLAGRRSAARTPEER